MTRPDDIAGFAQHLARSGRRQWRGLDDPALAAEWDRLLGDEFPSFRAAAAGTDRREFLRIMAASLTLAGAAGCSPQRSEDAIPYVVQPEEVVPGRPSLYASTVTLDGYAQPVLAAMHRGRPTKLEGNPEHPAVRGRTDLFTQAAILDLYDPDRSPLPLHRREPATLAAFDRLLPALRESWRSSGGEGLAVLIGPTTSPTLLRQLALLATAYPNARIHAEEAAGSGSRLAAARLAFGRPLVALPRLDRTRFAVILDDDPLGPGPAQVWNLRHWAMRRGDAVPAADRIRLLVAECTPTQTGAVADRRFPAMASRMPALAAAIAAALGLPGSTAPDDLDEAERRWVSEAAAGLKAHFGASLLLVGSGCPPETGALAAAINERLGNAGQTLTYAEPFALAPEGPIRTVGDLAADLKAGRVTTLVIADSNPVYATPAALDFEGAMKRAKLVIHCGLHADETAAAADWHLPLPHALESWGDARAVDGTASVIQPLIEPLYASRSLLELLHLLVNDEPVPALDLVRETWREQFGAKFEERWRRCLHDGFVPDSSSREVGLVARLRAASSRPPGPEADPQAVEIVVRPDPTVRDGRFANNAWLQELGKPLTKTTWENVVLVSPHLAAARGIGHGDRVRVQADGRSVEGPAFIAPGQADRTVTLFLGYGRRRGGQVCEGIGYDAYPLLAASPGSGAGTLARLGPGTPAASTQTSQAIEGDDFVRVVPSDRRDARRPEDAGQSTIYPEWPPGQTAWGMVIDLDLCSGCNACAVACQAENNVPVVGREQVRLGRHMHWLRVDHYHSGGIDAPRTAFQPVPCMHCEQAPCEMGCPVHATVHGPEGLNEMVYNRCIGTRTCSSYCPYKVRRFNWYDYTSGAAESVVAQRNPDVTVRARGVMEKCTYCVQRIRAAQVEADKENRTVRDGEVVTACQAACPSTAIVFGNIADPGSAVARARANGRNYALLAHLGTRPRTTYLARIEGEGEETP